MKPFVYVVIMLLTDYTGQAQKKLWPPSIQSVELVMAAGKNDYTIAGSFENNFQIGKQKRLLLGAGIRITVYGASNKDYFTAPASLAKGATGPGILFKERINENLDTIQIGHPRMWMINLMAIMSFRVLPKLYTGFNIDVTGFSFGKMRTVRFIHDGNVTTTEASPARLNLLKIDDNAIGSQNSQFYLLYMVNGKVAIKAFYQLLYVEYKTTEKIQMEKGGFNNRFRNVPKGWGIGLSYHFKFK
ncbi:hypothetical protein A3860_11760 [Niastella vici]|uniref:Outer membrane protein beta-barrel domain-containing protein n=1 Tax=Niastella vici TaxID=1703345 RepID=A0A1V9FG88_9BACT|nr:hypothetical protein [Niastella vici]OQP57226.1 hypothetical protein A3860_11760 [Niastella vici]